MIERFVDIGGLTESDEPVFGRLARDDPFSMYHIVDWKAGKVTLDSPLPNLMVTSPDTVDGMLPFFHSYRVPLTDGSVRMCRMDCVIDSLLLHPVRQFQVFSEIRRVLILYVMVYDNLSSYFRFEVLRKDKKS